MGMKNGHFSSARGRFLIEDMKCLAVDILLPLSAADRGNEEHFEMLSVWS